MGRCSFNYRPRFYTFLPCFNDVDSAVATLYRSLGHWTCLGGGKDPVIWGNQSPTDTNLREVGVQVLGCSVSAIDITNAGGTCLIHGSDMPNAGTGRTVPGGSPIVVPTAANNPDFTAIIRNSDVASGVSPPGEGAFFDDKFLDGDNTNLSLRAIATGGADQYIGLSGVYVVSAPAWNDRDTVNEIYPNVSGGITHDSGPVAGGLTIFPIPSITAMSGNGVIRKMKIPMDLRVLGVVFTHDGAGGTPTMQLLNDTTGEAITPTVVMTGANQTVKEIGPDKTDVFTNNGSSRDLTRHDIISLELAGFNTSFDRPSAYLIVAVRGHMNPSEPRRDTTRDGLTLGDAPNVRSFSPYRSVSGPATGGIAYWPFGQSTLAANQSLTTLVTLPAPFDCEVLGAVLSNRVIGTAGPGYDCRFRNLTTSTDIVTGMDMDYYYGFYAGNNEGFAVADWNGSYGFPTIEVANRVITRGDSIALQVDTPSGKAAEELQGGLYVWVKGFPSHPPELD